MKISMRGITFVPLGEGKLPIAKSVKSMAFFPAKRSLRSITAGVAVVLMVLLCGVLPARASDHQDTTFLATQLTSADLTDLYVFPSADPSKVVLAMDFDPLISQGEIRPFDPSVLYQFKIDNTGDGVEDVVLQFQVNGTDPDQTVTVYGPSSPIKVGTNSKLIAASGTGPLNQTFSTPNGLTVFFGLRKDPFFFDLLQFFKIIPDRNYQNQPNPAPPLQVLSFNPPDQAQDLLDSFNVHSAIVELPRELIGSGKIGVWITTSVKTPRLRDGSFAQIERLAVPALNELFMDFQAHYISNLQTPTNDAGNQSNFIQSFIQAVGRPKVLADTIVSVVTPDVIQADLSQPTGSYFGTQLAKDFGGRRPKDDVIDVTLSIVFGDVVTPDGDIPALTTDNVGPKDINFLNSFPYLGDPR